MKTFILSVLIAVHIFAFDDSLIVRIDDSGISINELKQRFELIPQVTTGIKKDLEQKKNDLLYSLIAEKLWAKEAEQLKLDTSDIMRITFKTIEKMFVRDALYKIEITDKIKFTDEEKLEALKRIYTCLDLDVLRFTDSVKAVKSYQLLKNGISFDSVKFLAENGLPAIRVKYGEFTEHVEDVLFNLKQNEFTAPIKSSSGWLIFKLLEREPVSLPRRDQALKETEEIMNQRKTEKRYNEFFSQFFSGRTVETDVKLFWSITEKLNLILSEKKTSNSIPDSENVYLEVNDLLHIEQELGLDTMNMPFVEIDEFSVTVKEFLREFIFDGFYSADVKPNVIATKLNSRVKTFIEQELLAREGYRRGLQNLSEVKSSIAMWRDNYLAKVLKNMLLDSVKVTDEEVFNYFKNKNGLENKSMVEVNILEILTDSLEVIESVFHELENGGDFRQLASAHTKRVWTRDNGGEFGFFPSTMYGELGRIASTMKVGEIYGPIRLLEGYSIFKLIDRKESIVDSTLSFEESRKEIRKNLTYKKLGDFFIDYTVKLANKFGVTINEQLMKTISVSDFNMLVFRQMGFGGQLTAAPITLPFTEWFLPWTESKKLMP